jgi:hypothetical protein
MLVPVTPASPPAAHALNVFQRLMRHWDTLHPYNAAQVMELAPGVALEPFREAWPHLLRSLGLGEFRLEHDRFTVTPLPGGDPRSQAADTLVGSTIASHLSDGLNRPFDPRTDVPLRAFAATQSGRGYVGIVYQHWVADSVAIRTVMRQWLDAAVGRPDPLPAPLRMIDRGYFATVGPAAARAGWLGSSLHTLRAIASMKRVRRIRPGLAADGSSRFRLFDLPNGLAEPLRARARAQGLTINDLFVAAAAHAVLGIAALERPKRRQDLCIGTIVDLRRAAGVSPDRFGMLLGFVHALFRPREQADFASLCSALARRRRCGTQGTLACSSFLRIAIGLMIAGRCTPERQREFYRKRMPMAAGVSNVNLNRDFPDGRPPREIVRYFRVSPTGPMLPMVFTPSTFADTMNVGVTYRPGVVSDAEIAAVAGRFRDTLVAYARG